MKLTSGFAQQFNTFFNVSLALFFIIAGLPVFLLIVIAIAIADGPPILYRGDRMGKNKHPYKMFKFRTLVVNAEARIGAQILSEKMAMNQSLEHRFGRFLRNSRLDELPQLFNILRGEMNFVGPRPVRRVIYQQVARDIPGYDRRFDVKPGLLGVSQVFTPHSTPKRFRAKIDYMFVTRKTNYLTDFNLIMVVVFGAIRQTIRELLKRTDLLLRNKGILGNYKEKRRLVRKYPKKAQAFVSRDSTGEVKDAVAGRLMNINAEMLVIQVPEILRGDRHVIRITTRGRGHLIRYAILNCELIKQEAVDDPALPYRYLLRHESSSPLNHYRLHQYFLKGSFI